MSPILFRIFYKSVWSLAASKYISYSFFLIWLDPVKTLCFSEQIRICQTFVRRFCIFIMLAEVIWIASMQGFLGPLSHDFVILFFICGELYLHLRGLSPVVCTYHLLLLLQHEERMWLVCLRSLFEGAYYYYYYYYYYTMCMSPVTGISSWYFSWTSGGPQRSGFKLHIAVLSVLCVMFQV